MIAGDDLKGPVAIHNASGAVSLEHMMRALTVAAAPAFQPMKGFPDVFQ
jgi:hypothetical protein